MREERVKKKEFPAEILCFRYSVLNLQCSRSVSTYSFHIFSDAETKSKVETMTQSQAKLEKENADLKQR
jgi:hypothetical protein